MNISNIIYLYDKYNLWGWTYCPKIKFWRKDSNHTVLKREEYIQNLIKEYKL